MVVVLTSFWNYPIGCLTKQFFLNVLLSRSKYVLVGVKTHQLKCTWNQKILRGPLTGLTFYMRFYTLLWKMLKTRGLKEIFRLKKLFSLLKEVGTDPAKFGENNCFKIVGPCFIFEWTWNILIRAHENKIQENKNLLTWFSEREIYFWCYFDPKLHPAGSTRGHNLKTRGGFFKYIQNKVS